MVAQQSRAKKGKAGNGRKSLSQSIARNNNTATQDDENISINLILAILRPGKGNSVFSGGNSSVRPFCPRRNNY